MLIREFKEKFPSMKTLTVGAIAHKHNVTVKSIRQQLTKGIKVEKEHTTDHTVAKEIALDHLAEYPDYYDRLETVEEDKETLNPPSIDVGDEVKVGKFKNSKATVKGFKKDDHNQPVLKTNKGDKKLFNLRLSKLQTEEAPPGREKQVKALKGKVDNPYAVAWASYNKSKK